MSMEERLNNIEYRQKLLFENTPISRFLFESNTTESEYIAIMDLLAIYQAKIEKGEKVSSGDFECQIYNLVPSKKGDYHYCELVSKLFAEEGQWEDVFTTLYGDLAKYK